MAKQLKKIFDPSVDEVQQTFTINAWHVSQSVDALTGAEDYDITISGSLTITGSVAIDGIEDANGLTVKTVVRDPSTGRLYITSSAGSSSPDSLDIIGGGCTKYNLILSTDTGSIPSSGQAILISGSVYGDNETYGAIRIHEEDANGDNVNNFLGTTFGSKQFNIHWASASLITTEANSSSQRFNQSITIVTDISCSTEPAPGDPNDPGDITPPPYVSPSSSAVGPVSMVYSETLQGLKTGGTAVSLVDIYLDPLFVYADLEDTGSSAKFQTTVFRRDNLAFVTEYTSESIMAYANTYLNSSQFNFDPSIYDGTQTPYLYRTESMSSEAPEGYYIFASEYTDANLLKNAAKYEGSGVFDSKFPGFDYTPPAPTPPADPTTIEKCTITTQTLAVSKSGDYWEIPWELDAYSGSYAPTSFSSSYICFDADGSYSSLGGAGGSGGSGGAGGTETLTALGYNDDSKLLAYVDEELSINIRDLNSAGNLDFKLNGGSTISEASILNLIEGDNVGITLSESPSGTAAYTISASIDTGSFYLSSSISGNTITFTQGDGTTESVTVASSSTITGSYTGSTLTTTIASINWTGSGVDATAVGNDLTIYIPGQSSSIDTGSFYLSSSILGNVITFTQGDGTTESVTVPNSSTITGSYTGSTLTNTISSINWTGSGVVATNSGDDLTIYIPGQSSSIDTGSFYTSSSISGDIITFNQGDGTIETIDLSEIGAITGSHTGSTLTTTIASINWTGSGVNASAVGDDLTIYIPGDSVIDTGSFYLSSSIAGNVITFTQGDGTTESVTITNSAVITGSYTGSTLTTTISSINWTGSGVVATNSGDDLTIYIPGQSASIDTGSFYVSSSIAGNIITFNQGDGTTESVTITNSATITGSNDGVELTTTIASINWTGSGVVATNSGDDLTIYIPGAGDTGSFYYSSSVDASSNKITFNQEDGTTEDVIVPNIYTVDGLLTGNRVVNSNDYQLLFRFAGFGEEFAISSSVNSSISIVDLLEASQSQVLGINPISGLVTAMNTSSFTVDTGSFLVTSSLTDNVMTFERADSSSYDIDLSGVFVDEALRTAITVKNVWVGPILKGTPCYITASGTSGNVVGVVPASASDATVMPAGVIAGVELTNVGDEGIGYINGWINNVDTSQFQSGDSIYVGVDGGYTNVRPTGDNLVQKIGNVEKSHASNGSGVIVGAGRANDVPNINPGYLWVGDNDWIAQPIPTSSLVTALTGSHTGSTLTNTITSINWTGSGVDATVVGNDLTIYIPGQSASAFLVTASSSDTSNVLAFTKESGEEFFVNIISSSYAVTSSYTVTSSYALSALSASYGPNIYNTDGGLTGNRNAVANGFALTWSFQSADWILNSNPNYQVQINGLPLASSSQVLGVENGVLRYMNTSSIGGVPDTPLNSLQYNSGSVFGGTNLYFDEANQYIGLGVATPSRPFHISSSIGLPFRIQTNASSSRMQFIHSSTHGAKNNVAIIGSTGSNAFVLEQDDSGLKLNQYVSSSGEVHFPRIAGSDQSEYVKYNTSSGEITYYDKVTADYVNLTTSSANADYRVLLVDSSGLEDEIIYVDDNNGLTFNPSTNSLQSKGEVIAYYASDKRLKDNLTPIANPLEKLSKINGYEFDWNENQQVYQGHDIGVIAQEIEEILPELVQTRDNGYKAVKYEKLTSFLISVVKEQQSQIEDLKSRIDNLEK